MAQQARDEAGNIWEIDEQGNPVRLVQAAPQPNAPIAPPNPAQAFEAPKAQADAQRAQAEAALAAAQAPYAAHLAQAEAARALAEAEKARAEAARDPNAQVLDRGKIGQFLALEKQLGRIQELYEQGPGRTSGVGAIADYLPSDVNSAFDSAGAGLSEVGLAAFRVPGAGSQSDAELRQFIAANTPRASDRDSAIREKLANLQRRLEATKQAWGVDPQAPAADLLQRFGGAQPSDRQGSAMDVLRIGGDQGGGTAAPRADVGSGQKINESYPEAMVREHDAIVARLVSEGGGRLDPNAYAAERARLDAEFGYQGDPTTYAGWANSVNQYIDAGGRTIPSGIQPAERLMTARETMVNNLVNNPLTATGIGASNALAFGVPEMIAPDEFGALRDAQGVPMMLGEAGGAIAGTAALGGIGRFGASRLAPSLLQGGGRGQFARNVGTDALYGGIYGGTTQGDPLTGAALGTGGSVVGQGVGRTVANTVGGIPVSEATASLRQQGVPISVARQVGLGRVEDAMQSLPLVGDVSRARQLESFEGFNRAAMEQAGRPIGFQPTQIGAGGVEDLRLAVEDAYGQAVQGVTAPLDRQFLRDMVPVRQMSRNLSPQNRAQLAETLQDAVQIPASARAITPEQFQDAISSLKALRSNAKGAMPNSANTLRKSATQTINALEGAMMRAGGEPIVEGLRVANAANRGFKTIESAALDAAKVGTQTGAPNVFTPAQLIGAARAAEKRGYGQNPLMPLARQGQEVLPSTLPNSGTTDRAIMTGTLGTLGLGGVGALGGAASADQPNLGNAAEGAGSTVLTGAGILGALGLLGTRRGQAALERVLITRPQMAQQAGQAIRRRSGIFGSAALPTFVQMNQPQPIYVPQ
jgi:hypothetical protein